MLQLKINYLNKLAINSPLIRTIFRILVDKYFVKLTEQEFVERKMYYNKK